MPLQRSLVENTDTLFVRDFVIEPEYLETEEIRHELRARCIDAAGERRMIADRLRKRISDEKKNPSLLAFVSVGNPASEVEYVATNAERLRERLSMVTMDSTSHDRFMSLYLHLVHRLNRIPGNDGDMEFSAIMSKLNEALNMTYHEFVDRVRRLVQQSRRKNDLIPSGQPKAAVAANKHVITTSALQNNNNMTANGQQQAAGTSRAVANDLLITASNDNDAASNIQQRATGAIRAGANEPLIATNNNNAPQATTGYVADARGQIFGPQHLHNGTFRSNHNVRLSEHFMPANKSVIPPISPTQPRAENRERFSILVDNSAARNNANGDRQGLFPMVNDLFGTRDFELNGSQPPMGFGNNRYSEFPFPSTPPYGQQPRYQIQREIPTSNIDTVNEINRTQFIGDKYNSNTNGEQSMDALRAKRMEETLRNLVQMMGSFTDDMNEFRQWRQTQGNLQPQSTARALHSDRMTHTVCTSPRQQQHPSEQRNNELWTQRRHSRDGTYTVNRGQYNDEPPFSNFSNSHRNNPRVVPVHKWNLKFTGDSSSKIPEEKDLTAFLKRLELLRVSEQMSYDDVFYKFHYLLGGTAGDWFMHYRQTFNNWVDLREGLEKQFTTPMNNFLAVSRLASKRQGKDESTMHYIASVMREFDALKIYSEQERIAVIQNGLRDELRQIARGHTWTSVQEMDLHLRTNEVAEELHRESAPRIFKPFFSRKAIHMITGEETQTTDQSECTSTSDVELTENEEQCEESCCNAVRSQRFGSRQISAGNSAGKATSNTHAKRGGIVANRETRGKVQTTMRRAQRVNLFIIKLVVLIVDRPRTDSQNAKNRTSKYSVSGVASQTQSHHDVFVQKTQRGSLVARPRATEQHNSLDHR